VHLRQEERLHFVAALNICIWIGSGTAPLHF